MKTLIILGDGMADYPIESLNNQTPLMAAHKPHMDLLAKKGCCGLFKTVPDDMPPGSEVANMAVLGYDVRKVYQGRGVLEAAAMGVALQDEDLAMRCNLICLQEGLVKNHSAGHISTAEASILIDYLKENLAAEGILFHSGVSYRHLLVVKNGSPDVDLTPPHNIPGKKWTDYLPKPLSHLQNEDSQAGEHTAKLLTGLIVRSQSLLENHPVNIKRRQQGKDPANSIWFWSAGKKPQMKTFRELYGKSGAVISAVDLLHGIGVYAGFKLIHVEGATGLYNTNYEGKVAAALQALQEVDLVYLHIEAADEAGHEGDIALKIKCIEAIDSRVVKPVLHAAETGSEPFCIALLPDHPTPCSLRTHTHDPVPFVIFKPGTPADSVDRYDEESVKQGFYGLIENGEFMRLLLS